MRVSLTAQWDCVWLLLADHNTMKKEPLHETNDTSPYELRHFLSKVFLENKHMGVGNISKRGSEKSGLKNLKTWWMVRAKQNHWSERWMSDGREEG